MPASAETFHFQATDLGSYLLSDCAEALQQVRSGDVVDAEKGPATRRLDGRRAEPTFIFTLPMGSLEVGADGRLATARPIPRSAGADHGCQAWPEVEVERHRHPRRLDDRTRRCAATSTATPT